ncbi:hypothetical protein HJG60_010806 [Phyllostomus discolor]|uniref:Uncharacterized protein n=1 Tax=Phyllostomus discolor TaxID=89673 RepID=A0A834A7J8_9CHIR|nr:hypothetical protein HJG60_010806 [Phyllostomus discolor]
MKLVIKKLLPWLVWLSGLSAGLQTESIDLDDIASSYPEHPEVSKCEEKGVQEQRREQHLSRHPTQSARPPGPTFQAPPHRWLRLHPAPPLTAAPSSCSWCFGAQSCASLSLWPAIRAQRNQTSENQH